MYPAGQSALRFHRQSLAARSSPRLVHLAVDGFEGFLDVLGLLLLGPEGVDEAAGVGFGMAQRAEHVEGFAEDVGRLVDLLRQEKKKFKDVQEALEAIYRQMHKPR